MHNWIMRNEQLAWDNFQAKCSSLISSGFPSPLERIGEVSLISDYEIIQLIYCLPFTYCLLFLQ